MQNLVALSYHVCIWSGIPKILAPDDLLTKAAVWSTPQESVSLLDVLPCQISCSSSSTIASRAGARTLMVLSDADRLSTVIWSKFVGNFLSYPVHKEKRQMKKLNANSNAFFYQLSGKQKQDWMKKVLGETQTLRAGRSNAEPKIFAPPQTHFLGPQDHQNLISWRWSVPSPTDPVWWRSMHAISSYRGNRHRPPARCHKPTDRTDYNSAS